MERKAERLQYGGIAPSRRYAVYYTPRPATELAKRGAAWLGRDVQGTGRGQPAGPADLVAVPSRYGFHATLKAPFSLAPDRNEEQLLAALATFAAQTPAVTVPDVGLAQIENFFALVPRGPSTDIDRLAERIVRTFDGFRAPLTPAQISRRNPCGLSPVQRDYLLAWGYPHVLDQFRFHMTLTDTVAPDEQGRVKAQLTEHFGDLLPLRIVVDQLVLVVEETPGADFLVHSSHALATIPQDGEG